MKKALIIAFVIAIGAYGAYMVSSKAKALNAEAPRWLESDSAAAIEQRTLADFCLSRAEMLEKVQERHPEITDADLDTLIAKHYVEAITRNGELRFHRKSPRNLALLHPAYNGQNPPRGAKASAARISYVDSILDFTRGRNALGGSHLVRYRFSVDVPSNETLAGNTIRVWMPVPLDRNVSSRQSGVEILAAEPADYILSGDRSAHNTIYFEAPAPAPGDTAHFEYVGQFYTSGQYVPAEEIERNIMPYDTSSADYRRYTSAEAPHIIRLDSLAHAIVGSETNPFRQSEMVYDYIINRYPWAGAREYSTIACIPQYVIDEGHGDCGQVSLLYISLMRSLGVPARWESGWMLHPGEVNLHDWAEVYFEGIGWLPVDVSFGRYTAAADPEARTFYSHGMDAHRFATNRGVGSPLFPAKRFVRSETVDFQLGEVECSKGNLYYPAWDSHMKILSVEAVDIRKK